MKPMMLLGPLLVGVAAGGCEDVLPEPDLERMIEQPSFRAYEAAPWFADGRAMRPPPLGTIPRGRALEPSPLTEGRVEGTYVDDVPLEISRPLLLRGRDRYQRFCAPCHGPDGTARTPVARDMQLRPPPSLLSDRVRAFPAGQIFQVISLGYGLMPSYAEVLPVPDRWAVVAYLEALQLSQATPLEALPPRIRQEATRALRQESPR